MEYNLKEFTSDTLEATERKWNNDLKSSVNVFPGDTWRILKLAKSNSDYKNTEAESLAYGVFCDANDVADSVVEVIISKSKKKVIKLIDCFIRPSLSESAYNKDVDAINKLAGIYTSAIFGTLKLADHHQMPLVKVYGRSEPLLYILAEVAKNVNEAADNVGLTAKIVDRWLEIKPI